MLAAILLHTGYGGFGGYVLADEAAAAAPPPQADSVAYPPGLNAGTSVDLQWPVPADTKAPTTSEVIQNVAHNKISINIVWTLMAAFLAIACTLVGFLLAK